jgi:hypothetical protein
MAQERARRSVHKFGVSQWRGARLGEYASDPRLDVAHLGVGGVVTEVRVALELVVIGLRLLDGRERAHADRVVHDRIRLAVAARRGGEHTAEGGERRKEQRARDTESHISGR